MLEFFLWLFDWGFVPVGVLILTVWLYSEEIGAYFRRELQTLKETRPSVRPTPRWIVKLEAAVRELEAVDSEVDQDDDDRCSDCLSKIDNLEERIRELEVAGGVFPLVHDLVQDKVPSPETDRGEAGA